MTMASTSRDVFLVVAANGILRADLRLLVGHDARLKVSAQEDLQALDDPAVRMVIFDVAQSQLTSVQLVKIWRDRALARGHIVIFVSDPAFQKMMVDEGLIRNVNLVLRPLSSTNFLSLIESLWQKPRYELAARNAALASRFCEFPDQAEALHSADSALTNILNVALGQTTIRQQDIEDRCSTVVDSLASTGAPRWTEAVRSHHSLTYQHSLLVLGTSVAFGQHLGFCDRDLKRLAAGALLHDLGKSRIPVAILDKPGSLTTDELTVVKSHPVIGHSIIKDSPDFTPEILNLVLHHHEFLDGSGYPDGLTSGSIPDITRLLTIADIFSALVEKRPYKTALSGEKAYRIMQLMSGKLDMKIMRPLLKVAEAIPAAL